MMAKKKAAKKKAAARILPRPPKPKNKIIKKKTRRKKAAARIPPRPPAPTPQWPSERVSRACRLTRGDPYQLSRHELALVARSSERRAPGSARHREDRRPSLADGDRVRVFRKSRMGETNVLGKVRHARGRDSRGERRATHPVGAGPWVVEERLHRGDVPVNEL